MNRVVIVTGSTRGIGFETAKKFLESDDKVTVFCRHDEHTQEAVEQLSQFGNPENILGLEADVRNNEDVKRVVKKTLDKFGRIDVLVNNAGIAVWKELEETSSQEWEDVIQTNLRGAFLFMHEVVPLMKKQEEGIVINISSGLGVSGGAKYSAYSSSKFGLIGLTQVAANENENSNLKFYAVLPGAVATKLHLDIHPWEDASDMMTAEHVGSKIFDAAEGKKSSGESIKVYS